MSVKRHPIMGFFAGLFLGLGLFLVLSTMGVVPLSVMWLAILGIGGIVVGIALAYAVPARGRKAASVAT
jgi:hypothetical protein